MLAKLQRTKKNKWLHIHIEIVTGIMYRTYSLCCFFSFEFQLESLLEGMLYFFLIFDHSWEIQNQRRILNLIVLLLLFLSLLFFRRVLQVVFFLFFLLFLLLRTKTKLSITEHETVFMSGYLVDSSDSKFETENSYPNQSLSFSFSSSSKPNSFCAFFAYDETLDFAAENASFVVIAFMIK